MFKYLLINKKRLLMFFLIVFLYHTMVGLGNFIYFVRGKFSITDSETLKFVFIMEMTGVYSYLLLLPFIIWFVDRYPINKKNLHMYIPLHLLASIFFGVSHTMLMYIVRQLIFWIIDFHYKGYKYGNPISRIPMEYTHQFFSYWFWYGVVQVINFVRKHHEQELKTARLEEQLTKTRLDALQTQLHPHFLFNTLNMISSIMYKDIKAADTMIANLSDLLRITLSKTNQQEHALEKELELVQYYIEIMKARFRDNVNIEMKIDKKTLKAAVPFFILQPLIENSIKYSMTGAKKAEIKLNSQKINGRLKIIIEDNGPGVSTSLEQLMQKGFGLSNTVKRLQNLYESDFDFNLENLNDGGLRLTIEIPFQAATKGKETNE
jgi:two-component system LytT family sensor kinase